MKNCTECKHAEWKRTEAGKLHPSGDGECKYPYKVPPLPASMYWIGGAPVTSGGHINRRKELRDHCTYYARKDTLKTPRSDDGYMTEADHQTWGRL